MRPAVVARDGRSCKSSPFAFVCFTGWIGLGSLQGYPSNSQSLLPNRTRYATRSPAALSPRSVLTYIVLPNVPIPNTEEVGSRPGLKTRRLCINLLKSSAPGSLPARAFFRRQTRPLQTQFLQSQGRLLDRPLRGRDQLPTYRPCGPKRIRLGSIDHRLRLRGTLSIPLGLSVSA